jgi:hypothetical protein
MFGMGNRHRTDRQLPGPPYPLDMIADLHAGVYPDEVADALRAKVLDDPDSVAIWKALDATTDELASAPVIEGSLPGYAQHKVDQALHMLAADHHDATAEAVTPLRRHRGAVLFSAVAAAAAVAAIAIATTFAFSDRSEPAIAEENAPTATPIVVPSDATLLSALGQSADSAFGDLARRDRCLAANEIQPATPVLGTSSIQAGGSPAVVILLSTGVAGRFDALVVGADCDTANPATLSRTTIGNK